MSIAVEARGLHKWYGRTHAVDGLELSVPTGSVYGLLGPNGAGKSTTFGVLCGWLHASSGTTRVCDVPSGELHRLRGRVAALPQDANFPPHVTVRKQLAHFGRLQGLAATAALSEADRVLERVDLRDAARMRGSELSHGMAKRVGLAQALIGAPKVLFLDEPTSGLDPRSARRIRDLVESLAPEATVVVSSHNLAEVQEICTHGAILDRGRLTVAGTIDALTRRENEILIVVEPNAALPEAALTAAFGPDAISRTGADRLVIRYASDRRPSDVIGHALRILLDSGTPILGERGTSLESAFLELTGEEDP